jgi:hypothetical protein
VNQAEWYTLYSHALVEHDPTKLRFRITEAEAAMFLRIQDLVENPDSKHEREIIANALSNLHALQRNMLRYANRQIA